MKPEIRKQWADALVSGEYKQGQLVLHSGDRFCPLGVLCDLYLKAHPDDVGWILEDEGHTYKNYSIHGSKTIPPVVVCEWADTDEFGPWLSFGKMRQVSVIELNDSDLHSITFLEIAEAIRAMPTP